MQWKRHLAFPVGLGVGLVLASVVAALVWLQAPAIPSHAVLETTRNPATAPAEHITRADINALKAELARLKDGESARARLASEVQRALASLHSRLTQVDQAQATMTRAISQITTQRPQARRDRAADPAREASANPVPTTPEDEVRRAEAQVQAQIDLLEVTMLAEAPDPVWTSAAERSLQSVFQREEKAGFHLVQTECRTTLCRLELSLDGSVSSEESFHTLVQMIPWQGQAFIRIEDGEGGAVMVYLAREGHALPQVLE